MKSKKELEERIKYLEETLDYNATLNTKLILNNQNLERKIIDKDLIIQDLFKKQKDTSPF